MTLAIPTQLTDIRIQESHLVEQTDVGALIDPAYRTPDIFGITTWTPIFKNTITAVAIAALTFVAALYCIYAGIGSSALLLLAAMGLFVITLSFAYYATTLHDYDDPAKRAQDIATIANQFLTDITHPADKLIGYNLLNTENAGIYVHYNAIHTLFTRVQTDHQAAVNQRRALAPTSLNVSEHAVQSTRIDNQYTQDCAAINHLFEQARENAGLPQVQLPFCRMHN